MNAQSALDPGYAQAYAGLAFAYLFDYSNRWTGYPDGAMQRADELATKAIAIDPNDPYGYAVAAISAHHLNDDQRAQSAIDRALALNPNYALALNVRGSLATYTGHPEAAIPDIERAMRLDPGFSQQYLHYLGFAHLLLGNYETAATVFKERILLFPQTDVSRGMLAAALGHLGRVDEARQVWDDMKKANPAFSFFQHLSRIPIRNPTDVDRIASGPAKAGLQD